MTDRERVRRYVPFLLTKKNDCIRIVVIWMNKVNNFMPIYIFWIFFLIECYICYVEGEDMSETVIAAIIGAVTTIVGIIITNIATSRRMRKSQIEKNTKMLEELKKQYESLYSGMGVRAHETLSLTGQHDSMKKEIMKSYAAIRKRYKKEDKAYKNFTAEQRDLKQTLDNFSKDYIKQIETGGKLRAEIFDLQEENQRLKEQIAMLEHEKYRSKKKISGLQTERDEPDMERYN